jgi:hypothetical protein
MTIVKSNSIFSVGVASLAAPTFSYIIVVAGLLLGFAPGAWIWPVAVLAAAALAWRMQGWRSVIIFLALLALFTAISYVFEDETVDGTWYHQPCILRIINGWNPFTTRLDYPCLDIDDALVWNQHYCKGLEMIQTAPVAFFRFSETAKIINWLFLTAVACLVYDTLRVSFPRLSALQRFILTALFTGNPVCLTQAFCTYNDFMLYCGLVVMGCCLLRLTAREQNGWLTWSILAAITIIMVNVKFTHAFYCALMWAVILAVFAWRKSWPTVRRAFAVVALSGLLGIFLFGWNPYVTNTVYYGSPAYPLYPEKIQIMEKYTMPLYRGHNRFVNFWMSHLSPVEPDCQKKAEAWSMLRKRPSFRWLTAVNHDTYVAAYGPLYVWMLLVAFGLMLYVRQSKVYWVTFLLVFAAAFIFEQSWWTRYVPFTWALPLIALLASTSCEKSRTRVVRAMQAFIIFCGLVSSTFALKVSATRAHHRHVYNSTVESWGDKAIYSVRSVEYFEYDAARWPQAQLVDSMEIDRSVAIRNLHGCAQKRTE